MHITVIGSFFLDAMLNSSISNLSNFFHFSASSIYHNIFIFLLVYIYCDWKKGLFLEICCGMKYGF